MKSTTATTARARLVDSFGRAIEYVRLSVTDRCNLRCFYCLPRGVRRLSEPDHWLRFGEIERLMRAFATLGVQRLRLTGGEPLVRARLPELAARLSVLPGIADVSLSTNATLLADYAEPLRRAGVTRLNVSLDSLKPERFREITGGRLEPVLDGLLAARRAGFDWIKINMLALKGVNDDEFTDMVEFCAAHGFTLRFIEVMPVGRPGVEASRHYLDLRAVKARLAERFDLIPGVVPGGGRRVTCASAAPISISVSSPRCRSTSAIPATACASRWTARCTSASARTTAWRCGRCFAPARATPTCRQPSVTRYASSRRGTNSTNDPGRSCASWQ